MPEILKAFREWEYSAVILQKKEKWLPAGDSKACFAEEVTTEMSLTWGKSRIWIREVEEMGKGTESVFNKYLLAFESYILFWHGTASYFHLLFSVLWGKHATWFLFSLAVMVTRRGCHRLQSLGVSFPIMLHSPGNTRKGKHLHMVLL